MNIQGMMGGGGGGGVGMGMGMGGGRERERGRGRGVFDEMKNNFMPLGDELEDGSRIGILLEGFGGGGGGASSLCLDDSSLDLYGI